jgi:hypothetical protein
LASCTVWHTPGIGRDERLYVAIRSSLSQDSSPADEPHEEEDDRNHQ